LLGVRVDGQRRRHGDLEHEILAILATADTAMTPVAVRGQLGGGLAYNTVTTVLARLLDKGQVSRVPAGRTFAYQAVSQAQVAAFQMGRLMDGEQDRAAVLARFVGTLTAADEALLAQLVRPAGGEPR
jgi:predicted transcriptional regulator